MSIRMCQDISDNVRNSDETSGVVPSTRQYTTSGRTLEHVHRRLTGVRWGLFAEPTPGKATNWHKVASQKGLNPGGGLGMDDEYQIVASHVHPFTGRFGFQGIVPRTASLFGSPLFL